MKYSEISKLFSVGINFKKISIHFSKKSMKYFFEDCIASRHEGEGNE